jgi:CTP:molybdopterin cytidylyltransferase MocA
MSAAVVLAAGAGTRLGGVPKALLVHQDRTFLEHIVGAIRAAERGPLIVVVGAPYGDAVGEHARAIDPHVQIVFNPEPARGMASSIALGFRELDQYRRLSSIDDALLWPVDHPFVTSETLTALGDAIGKHDVARPVHGERRGHPPLIARHAWKRLAGCDQVEGGARAVIATLDVVDVPVDDPGVVRDIDTPEDREALR